MITAHYSWTRTERAAISLRTGRTPRALHHPPHEVLRDRGQQPATTTDSTGTGTGTTTGTGTDTSTGTGTGTDTGTGTGTTGGGGLGEGEVCQDNPDGCAPGLLCCYPCGIPDCMNKCIKPDPNTQMCPLFP